MLFDGNKCSLHTFYCSSRQSFWLWNFPLWLQVWEPLEKSLRDWKFRLQLVGETRRAMWFLWCPAVAKYFSVCGTIAGWGGQSSFVLSFVVDKKFGRTSLNEWLSRRRGHYLLHTHKHKTRTHIPSTGFEPAIPVINQKVSSSNIRMIKSRKVE
jgi:hypothetical protein